MSEKITVTLTDEQWHLVLTQLTRAEIDVIDDIKVGRKMLSYDTLTEGEMDAWNGRLAEMYDDQRTYHKLTKEVRAQVMSQEAKLDDN